MNPNTYVVDLPSFTGISRTFNVANLSLYHPSSDVPLYFDIQDNSSASSSQVEKTDMERITSKFSDKMSHAKKDKKQLAHG